MKVNLTKKNLEDIEKAYNALKSGEIDKKTAKEIAVGLDDILVKHELRKQKKY